MLRETTSKKFQTICLYSLVIFVFEVLFEPMKKLGSTFWSNLSKGESFKMKDEKVKNVYPKFRIILIIFEFLVELAI